MPKQKLTRQQSALRKMNLLKMDMLSMLDETIERFDIPYNPISPLKMAINDTINVVRQSMGRSHRIATLVNLYYLGELLNTTINPRQIWNNYIKENHTPNPTRYFIGAIRTYEIFQKDINQIYRTKTLSMHYITGMTNDNYYNDFLPFIKNISSEDFAI
jgi:hypothetical protein